MKKTIELLTVIHLHDDDEETARGVVSYYLKNIIDHAKTLNNLRIQVVDASWKLYAEQNEIIFSCSRLLTLEEQLDFCDLFENETTRLLFHDNEFKELF